MFILLSTICSQAFPICSFCNEGFVDLSSDSLGFVDQSSDSAVIQSKGFVGKSSELACLRIPHALILGFVDLSSDFI